MDAFTKLENSLSEEGGVITEAIMYVFNKNYVNKSEKYTGGRTLSAKAFGGESVLRIQYVYGSFFIDGYIENMKLRVYGNSVANTWKCFTCPMGDVINEEPILPGNQSAHSATNLYNFIKEQYSIYKDK